ncbi:hypothetical protein G7062_11370 [Erysipelothrix sp. HDW6C]|uniref:hypothetical protein n=1 Tax=Erysipelothrix sp. HDW6C TaxID=2714930 RepID=UPI00140B3B26|nr:hypothetical protein [Erysipelothrix sp. HDW6C]QIK70857.1 hypothetical protein G7062_11370 [Erysipelothrix sp. HDW6C]
MTKITAEEALNALLIIRPTTNDYKLIGTTNIVKGFIRQYLPPTFAELCGRWYSTTGLQVRTCTEYIEIYSEWSKISYYKVYYDSNNDRVWFNPQYDSVVWKDIELINLTIRYLESQKEEHDE